VSRKRVRSYILKNVRRSSQLGSRPEANVEVAKDEYLDLIVDALFDGTPHREIILNTIVGKESLAIKGLVEKIITARNNNPSKDWWKEELVRKNNNKNEIITFSGLNHKTVHDRLGTTHVLKVKPYCVTYLDQVIGYIDSLKGFPKFEMKITDGKKIVVLHTRDAYLFLKTTIAIGKQISGGTQSKVGKIVGERYLRRLFESLGISKDQNDEFYYDVSKTPETREVDGLLYYKGILVKQIEIKLLG
jgi:hypothetical protein